MRGLAFQRLNLGWMYFLICSKLNALHLLNRKALTQFSLCLPQRLPSPALYPVRRTTCRARDSRPSRRIATVGHPNAGTQVPDSRRPPIRPPSADDAPDAHPQRFLRPVVGRTGSEYPTGYSRTPGVVPVASYHRRAIRLEGQSGTFPMLTLNPKNLRSSFTLV